MAKKAFFVFRFIYLVFIVLLINQCTSPSGWKGSPYLYGSGKYGSLSTKARIVRVKIYEGAAKEIDFMGPYIFIKDNNSKGQGEGIIKPDFSGEFRGHEEKFKIANNIYIGRLKVSIDNGKYIFINLISEEEYLISVVGHEMNASWPLETLKAQTVVARTYLYQRMRENKDKIFDIDGTTKHQVYGGKIENDENLREAILKTSREVVMFSGDLAEVFFHSACGGHTEDAKEVWEKSFAYLTGKKTGFCKDSPEYSWKKSIPINRLEKMFGVKQITSVKIQKKTTSGRAESIALFSGSASKIVKADIFREKLDVKSTFFDLKIISSNLEFTGKGYGHGVGLCQWGSRKMVENKKASYKQIIYFYFPGTVVSRARMPVIT
ncbi:MAG: SpoIID/LytB domain-containing protein [Spirochaetia bacterium]|nr:SpoIID/LytB domain-containing protein [Spirochaetia bacterium]